MRYRTVFIDRDGVINRNRPDYVKRWDEFELISGAIEALARISASGSDLIVLTNQSAIAKRLVTRETVDEIHGRLAELVNDSGGSVRAFLVCPHAAEDRCDCRKPAPGLFFRARRELQIELAQAVMIGDQISDVQAAQAAGCEAILINPSGEARLPDGLKCSVVTTLTEAAEIICAP